MDVREFHTQQLFQMETRNIKKVVCWIQWVSKAFREKRWNCLEVKKKNPWDHKESSNFETKSEVGEMGSSGMSARCIAFWIGIKPPSHGGGVPCAVLVEEMQGYHC